MRKVLVVALALCITGITFAQNDTTKKSNILRTPSLPTSNDHFMLQVGYLMWDGKPDSINTSGLPRTFNAYFLFDFPFKTNPHFSAAIGAGIATDNMYFDNTNIGLKDNTPTISFRNMGDTSSFKKYKLTTAYAEAPAELRFSSKPDDNRRSFKVAVGAKAGFLLSAHTKGKNLQDRNGNTVNSYIQKEKDKEFINKTRLSGTARVGFGHFSLFGSYSFTSLFKEGMGPTIRPVTIGLTLSGL